MNVEGERKGRGGEAEGEGRRRGRGRGGPGGGSGLDAPGAPYTDAASRYAGLLNLHLGY